MGETIPCPAGCGGLVYDAGHLDASDLIELCGCRDAELDYPPDQGVFMPTGDDDSSSGPPFSAVIDRRDYDPAWEPNEEA